MKNNGKTLVALLTNNDDDVYCFRKELVEALFDNGYQVLISCPYGEKFDLLRDWEYIYDDPAIDRRGTNVIADLKLLCHYRKLFQAHHPSIILAYTAKPNVYGGLAAYSLGIPVISNLTGFGSVLQKKGLIRHFIMRLFKFAYTRSACVMFQNKNNMELALKMGMVKGQYKLLPGSGVALDRFPLQPYPMDNDKMVFNYIGRILHEKGVDDFIKAAEIIKAKHPETEFNMMGFIEPTEMHYEKKLKELEARGIIRYHGNLKDIRPMLARSHATIHPSIYGEGMSNVLLESAASGRPVITTDTIGCRETVLPDVSGFIYPGGNVDELCQTIEMFMALPPEKRREMGLAGRRHVENGYSRQIVIDAYLEAIEKTLH